MADTTVATDDGTVCPLSHPIQACGGRGSESSIVRPTIALEALREQHKKSRRALQKAHRRDRLIKSDGT